MDTQRDHVVSAQVSRMAQVNLHVKASPACVVGGAVTQRWKWTSRGIVFLAPIGVNVQLPEPTV